MGKPKIKLFFLPVASLLMISACTVLPNGSTMTPTLPITNMVSVLSTAAVPPSSPTPIIVSATPTIALTATETLIPTLPYTPTSSIPLVTVSVGTNCREGPGIIYNLLDGLMVGEQAQIVKLAPAGVDYVVIQRPHGPGECWLWLRYATITGDLSQLPIATIPPTPTSTMTPTTISTDTSTPTATDTAPASSTLAGEWNMFAFRIFSPPTPYRVNVAQVGNDISGSFKMGSGNTVTFHGTLASDGRTVTGTLTQLVMPTSGTFVWYIRDNLVQFSGHGDFGRGPILWCGFRDGQAAPEPCQSP